MLSTSVIKGWGNFRIFQFALAMHLQKKNCWNLAETFAYHVGNGFGIPWPFAKDYDLIFLTVDTACSICILLFTYNTLKRE